MNKMKETKMKPPYSSTGQSEEILNLFRRVTPKKLDSKYIVENKIATSPNASTVFNFARWMEIVDEEGNVNETITNKLKLFGDEREQFIKSMIEEKYKELFEVINLEEARKDDVINFFINNYGFGGHQAKAAAALFLHLCETHGISISDELKKKTHLRGRPKGSKTKKEKTSKKKEEKRSKQYPEKAAATTEDLKQNEILIEIKGNKGTYIPLKIDIKKESEENIKNKISSIINTLKIVLQQENTSHSSEITNQGNSEG